MRNPTINFRLEFLGAIRRGEKTQTRRPVRFSKVWDPETKQERRVLRPCPFTRGELHEVVALDDERVAWEDLSALEQHRHLKRHGQRHDAIYRLTEIPTGWYVRVTGHRQEALIDISDDDLAAEGYEDDREGFLDYMGAQHGEHVETVWVVEFQREMDVPMFPAKQAGYMHPEQYTVRSSEAMDKAEYVDEPTLASFAEHNRAKDTLRRLEANAERLDGTEELEDQLAAVRKLARERGINIRSTERLIGRKIEEIKKRLREAA